MDYVYLLERCSYPLAIDAEGMTAFGLFEEAFGGELVREITDLVALAYLEGH